MLAATELCNCRSGQRRGCHGAAGRLRSLRGFAPTAARPDGGRPHGPSTTSPANCSTFSTLHVCRKRVHACNCKHTDLQYCKRTDYQPIFTNCLRTVYQKRKLALLKLRQREDLIFEWLVVALGLQVEEALIQAKGEAQMADKMTSLTSRTSSTQL